MHLVPPGRQSGFSLVEVMVTVVLIAILAGLAAPSFQGSLARFRVRASAEGLTAGLQLARSEALRRNHAVRFSLGGSPGNWSVATVSPAATIQDVRESGRAGVTVTANSGQASVTFLPSGLVDTSSSRIEQIDVGTTVSGVTGLRIAIHGGGQIQLCDPAVATANDPRKC